MPATISLHRVETFLFEGRTVSSWVPTPTLRTSMDKLVRLISTPFFFWIIKQVANPTRGQPAFPPTVIGLVMDELTGLEDSPYENASRKANSAMSDGFFSPR